MKGDFTRNTFDPEKHYSHVLMQQGRVQVDADWNEQQAITRYRIETEAQDVIGLCGAPKDNAGFGVSPTPDGSDLIISPGRIYVDGILCELEAQTTYLTQPDYPKPPALQFLSSTEDPSTGDTRTDQARNDWISFERTVPVSVAVGVPFQVTVTNTAVQALASARVADELPAGLTLVDGSVTASAIELSAGDSFTNTYTVKATASGTIAGSAQAMPPGVTTPPPPLKLESDVEVASASPGPYLVYLDVWRRHVTALDDPLIREVALGGPDTATRVKTLWQVKAMPLTSPNATCGKWPEGCEPLPISTGTLNARTKETASDADPCLLPPTAGYKRLENQLYRVEIHDGGKLGQATFKWSRDNGTVVTAIEEIDGIEITVHDVGRDEVLGFAPGQWVEISNDILELHGKPGELFQIVDVNPATRVVTLSDAPSVDDDPAYHPKMRRWDSQGAVSVEIPADNDGWIELEGGIEVQFSEEGVYKTGGYWLIPARTATGEIEWPPYQPGADTIPQPPLGIEHHYCRLALVGLQGETEERALIRVGEDGNLLPDLAERWEIPVDSKMWVFYLVQDVMMPDGTPFTAEVAKEMPSQLGLRSVIIDDYTLGIYTNMEGVIALSDVTITVASGEAGGQVTDCRRIFPPLTEITSGGGHRPYLTLRYMGGDGQEGPPGDTLPCTLAVGVEDENGKPAPGVRVKFRVEEPCGSLLDLETGAGSDELTVLSDSSGLAEVKWDLGEDMAVGQCCRVTAQLAQPPQGSSLEIHFKATARQDDETHDWPQIKEISWTNNHSMQLEEFNEKGLWVAFTQAMDPQTITLDTFIVTLELPTIEPPLQDYESYSGHRIFIVPGKFEQNELAWRFIPQNLPEEVLGMWLARQEELFPELADLLGPGIRCRVLLKGNAILSAEGEPLDGEAFNMRGLDDSGATVTDLILPSGDGHKGGDFESWFYLIE
jgi:uncharacterized repeat protein (TIGR01451 family)